MNRWNFCFAMVFAGCIASIPPGDTSITADLACETGRAIVQARKGMPPTPVSDDCENCGGTGKLGDGRIAVQCPACKGTGKKPKPATTAPPCPTGSCPVTR